MSPYHTHTVIGWLNALHACVDAVEWVAKQPNLETAYRRCQKVSWLVWLWARRTGGDNTVGLSRDNDYLEGWNDCLSSLVCNSGPFCNKHAKACFVFRRAFSWDRLNDDLRNNLPHVDWDTLKDPTPLPLRGIKIKRTSRPRTRTRRPRTRTS